MLRDSPDQDPTPDGANIRSPEERYGGEGHAGTDPFERPKPGRDRSGGDDSPIEVPNATVDDLVPKPASAPERAEDDSGAPGGPADPKTRGDRITGENPES
jgi:hypothetical protein